MNRKEFSAICFFTIILVFYYIILINSFIPKHPYIGEEV